MEHVVEDKHNGRPENRIDDAHQYEPAKRIIDGYFFHGNFT